jgi:hypothetical protein
MKIRFLAISFVSIAVLFGCIITVHYLDEGTQFDPVQIQVGIPHQGTIGELGTSYYWFIVNVGDVYTIALTSTQSDLSWDLYDEFYVWLPPTCNDWDFAHDESSDVALAASTFFLEVRELDGMDGTFTLTVTSVP